MHSHIGSPVTIFRTLWANRLVVYRMVAREVSGRYRGSLLGFSWLVLTPILMLSVYTFIFSVVFEARWNVGVDRPGEFALILFAGLIVFQFFAECVSRAPNLLMENVAYIKKVVFPLECLAWVAIGTACFNLLVSTAVLLVAYAILIGVPPVGSLLLPIIFLPLVLTSLGLVWLLSALGIYFRDLRQIVNILVPILMFASPIFYPVSALPEKFQPYIYLNPLTTIIEGVRTVLAMSGRFGVVEFIASVVIGWLTAWFSLAIFMAVRRGFADVA
ncbi:MAG: ABC transporter permease [Rhodothermia bacterium]|nr:MAG: ABC transporter permease [Rhodothermia bacterium]